MTNIPAKQSDPEVAGEVSSDGQNVSVKIEDPIIQLIKDHWKNAATILAAALALIYFIQSFQESYETSMRSAADVFQRAQSEYENHLRLQSDLNALAKDDKDYQSKADDFKKKIAESKSQIEQLLNSAADAREPYKTLAVLYRGLLNKNENPALAAQILSPYRDWQNRTSGSEERFFSELAALQLAKIMLQQDEKREEAKSLLESLAKGADFVSVSAAHSLLSLSADEKDKEKNRKLIESLITEHPEQAELLDRILKNSV